MNTGMDLTFDLLATTRNEAAVGLLASSLAAKDNPARCRAIDALLRRRTPGAAMHVLRLWQSLSDAELRTVQDHPAAMQEVVAEVLGGPAEHPLWSAAIDALRMLNLTGVLPLVIDRAEASRDRLARRPLLAATIELCSSLGAAARQGREIAAARLPVVRRLAESVRRFEFHRCEELCDAFLAVSGWSDGELGALLGERSRSGRSLASPLVHSTLPAVIQLLTGFICRRQIPSAVRQALRTRSDEAFRDHLLQSVSPEPSPTTLRNLRTLGPLACLADWRTLAGRTRPAYQSALVHAHTANCNDPVRQLSVNLDVLAQGNREADAAVARSLPRCLPLDEAELLQAATRVAGADALPDGSEPLAQLLWRILQLLDHPSPAVGEALRGVLRPLDIDRFLDGVDHIRGARPEQLGRLVRRINPQVVEQISDELRHPVLSRRLRAIDAAILCDVLGPLEPLLLHAALHDHREAQVRVAGALAFAGSPASMELLQQLAAGPHGGLRDVARRSLEHRLTTAAAG